MLNDTFSSINLKIIVENVKFPKSKRDCLLLAEFIIQYGQKKNEAFGLLWLQKLLTVCIKFCRHHLCLHQLIIIGI